MQQWDGYIMVFYCSQWKTCITAGRTYRAQSGYEWWWRWWCVCVVLTAKQRWCPGSVVQFLHILVMSNRTVRVRRTWKYRRRECSVKQQTRVCVLHSRLKVIACRQHTNTQVPVTSLLLKPLTLSASKACDTRSRNQCNHLTPCFRLQFLFFFSVFRSTRKFPGI